MSNKQRRLCLNPEIKQGKSECGAVFSIVAMIYLFKERSLSTYVQLPKAVSVVVTKR